MSSTCPCLHWSGSIPASVEKTPFLSQPKARSRGWAIPGTFLVVRVTIRMRPWEVWGTSTTTAIRLEAGSSLSYRSGKTRYSSPTVGMKRSPGAVNRREMRACPMRGVKTAPPPRAFGPAFARPRSPICDLRPAGQYVPPVTNVRTSSVKTARRSGPGQPAVQVALPAMARVARQTPAISASRARVRRPNPDTNNWFAEDREPECTASASGELLFAKPSGPSTLRIVTTNDGVTTTVKTGWPVTQRRKWVVLGVGPHGHTGSRRTPSL